MQENLSQVDATEKEYTVIPVHQFKCEASLMESDESQSVEMGKYINPVPGIIRVLVVDSDSTCLEIVSKMLHILGYEVVTAKLGADALSIVQQKGDELHLMLVEAHLPDVEIFEFIDKIRESSMLPFSIMSADANESSMVEALEKGATRYLVKPIMFSDLGGLWQFATTKLKEEITASEAVSGFESSSNQSDEGNMSDRGKDNLQNAKRKQSEVLDRDEEGKIIEEPSTYKKKRLTWTDDLQKRFLDAIKTIGVDRARPKKILQLMNVPGLRKEKISSYLQKYRLSLKREEEAIQQNKINRASSYLSLGSDSNHLQSQTNYYQERYFPTLDLQPLTHKSNSIYTNNNYLSRRMSTHFLGPAPFPSQEISISNDSNPEQNQLILPWNQQQVAGIGQVDNYFGQRSLQSLEQQPVTYKTSFNSNYEKGLNSFMSGQGTSSVYESIVRQNELIPPGNLQGVANTTPRLDVFSINGGGKGYADVGQGENGEGIFSGNGFPSGVDNGNSGGNQIQYIQQDFPQQSMPSDEIKGHDSFEAIMGKIDEPLGIPEETLQFNEEDLDLFLSILNE